MKRKMELPDSFPLVSCYENTTNHAKMAQVKFGLGNTQIFLKGSENPFGVGKTLVFLDVPLTYQSK